MYRGVLNSETEPMIIGALGAVTGAVVLWAGAALLIRSRLVSVLIPAIAYLSVPTFRDFRGLQTLHRMADHAGGHCATTDCAVLVQDGYKAGGVEDLICRRIHNHSSRVQNRILLLN